MTAVEAGDALRTPSVESATIALRELGYGERLVLTRMNPASGHDTIDVYSFVDAVEVISETRWDELSMAGGSKAGIVWVDPFRVVAWLRDVIGDAELAQRVEAGFAGGDSYRDQIASIAPLLRERADQYRTLVSQSGTAQE